MQVVGQGQPLPPGAVGGVVVDGDPVPRGLGGVHGGVGAAQQFGAGQRVGARGGGDADARADLDRGEHLLARDTASSVPHPGRMAANSSPPRRARTAPGAGRTPAGRRWRPAVRVADGVPVLVVDLLETVEVQQEHAEPRPAGLQPEAAEELAAVGQPRQVVGPGLAQRAGRGRRGRARAGRGGRRTRRWPPCRNPAPSGWGDVQPGARDGGQAQHQPTELATGTATAEGARARSAWAAAATARRRSRRARPTRPRRPRRRRPCAVRGRRRATGC